MKKGKVKTKKTPLNIAELSKIILPGLGFGILFWFLESAVHVFIFHAGNFAQQLFFIEPHEIWMRLLVAGFITVFWIYTQFMIDRYKQAEEAVKFAYTELNQIFNTAADGMRLIDKNFNVIRVNKTFSILTGVSAAEAIGKKCYAIFRGSMCHTQQCPLVQIINGAKCIECDVEKETGDGAKISCIVTATPFLDAAGKLAGIVEDFKNISERKRVNIKLEELNKELVESNKRFKELALKDSHTGLYNHRYLEDAVEAEFSRAKRYNYSLSVLMMDIDYFKSINDVYGHQFGDLVLKQFADQLTKVVRRYDIVIRFGGEEFIIILPRTNKVIVLMLAKRILNVVNLYNFGDKKQIVKLRVSVAAASYPEDKIIKGLDLVNYTDKALSKAKEDGGNRVYSSADLNDEKISNMELEENTNVKLLKNKIGKLTKRANQSLIEAVFAFAKTIELKDHQTGEHVERTVYYAVETARALNLPRSEVERIKEASRLHDLGKVGISEQILLKPAKLSEEEFEEIKKHPQIGVDIIRPIQALREIIPLILYHQERWDGSGYCAGLKGEDIPVGARIIAVADVYEALISDRPYRRAYSKAEALKIIREGSGTQFDPEIVDIFLKVLQQEE